MRVNKLNCRNSIVLPIKKCARRAENQWKKNWVNPVFRFWEKSKKPPVRTVSKRTGYFECFLDFSQKRNIRLTQFFFHWLSALFVHILIGRTMEFQQFCFLTPIMAWLFIWPEGNPIFIKSMWSFGQNISKRVLPKIYGGPWSFHTVYPPTTIEVEKSCDRIVSCKVGLVNVGIWTQAPQCQVGMNRKWTGAESESLFHGHMTL